MQKIIPVILCGGSGSRLWPLSRMDVPKQFLRLLDDHSLLQRTARRALSVSKARESELVVVTLDSMRDETANQLAEVSPLLTRHILGEPQARNTAAAVAYAVSYVANTFGSDALAWILPADHHVGDEAALEDALNKAVAAAENGYLVTFGITPTRAEPGYGYILKDTQLNEGGVCKVGRFVEKPPVETAREYVDSGRYLWSSGMHLFRISTAAENFERHAPDVWDTIRRAVETSDAAVYCTAAEVPFESAVMEKAENIAVVPCDPQWSDIGGWESLWEIKSKNEHGNATRGRVVAEKTADSMILAHDKLVTCVGLSNIVIIETEDSILVADKRDGNALKALVKALQTAGHKEIMAPVRELAAQPEAVVPFPMPDVTIPQQQQAYGTA